MSEPKGKLSSAYSHLLVAGSSKCEQLPEVTPGKQKQRVRHWCGTEAGGHPCN